MTILQRSEDWHADRCGKITASRIKDIDAKPVKGKAHNALTLTILTERLTGVQEETKTTSLMQWGIDQEPYAIAAYENETGNFVVGTGLIDHPTIKMSGASPDGLVDQDGQLEVKCPSSQAHLNTILTQEVPSEYVPQITWQLACTRRKWCDFVSYDHACSGNHHCQGEEDFFHDCCYCCASMARLLKCSRPEVSSSAKRSSNGSATSSSAIGAHQCNLCLPYFGALVYKYKPIARKMKFGSQTAMKGDIVPVTENVLLTVENNT